MISGRGFAFWAIAVLAERFSVAVDLLADVGISRTRRDDGTELALFALQPSLLMQGTDQWFPTIGVRAGPAVAVDSDTWDYATVVEASLMVGAGWRGHTVRYDVLAAYGGGYWWDSGLLDAAGWGRIVTATALVAWKLDDRAWVGPSVEWSSRRVSAREIEDWSLGLALIYRLE